MEKQGTTIQVKQNIRPSKLIKDLADLGYQNVQIATPAKEGEFARRGNLIDIWLERYKMPVRIDLIGETIENIYLFNYLTQQKIKNLKEVYIVPFGVTPKIAPAWTRKKAFPSSGGKYERLFLSEIAPGDLVVHIDHGIGRFVDINQTSLAAPRQYLVIEYAKGDKLYVPVEQIERVTKYIGVGGYKPRLNTLGTGGWEKVKARVQESIIKAAQDLLNLYAKRELTKRHPYSADTLWQKQLEDSFEFVETEDQLKAIEEIKQDLENPKPMDRILVGDVGFGKTEVAIRIAFKIVQEGKQVAVLTPTTLLAEQHYHLFRQRLREFPVEVQMLSRFKREEEQRKIIANLKIGKIDIIISTHRLLSNDVEFKDLGLFIIDEEHRFGVVHKEKLKGLKTNVDVLSMSATPIPRSLHMALTKLRDMSVLKEPPPGRQPIETFIGELDNQKIKSAIEAEIKRNGQIYYVFNKVSGIVNKAAEVAKLVPKAKVVFAHGQMTGNELESVMDKFYSGRADVLVCTTIIGSGLDMPSVNTIIIEGVQRFGLAEVYQLRGRVGRSSRAAYAYLFYPQGYIPAGDVLERLLALSSAKELGAGFALAKKDLEIRGAGNLLGVAQHGNVALVGFELYLQLLSQTVEKLRLRI